MEIKKCYKNYYNIYSNPICTLLVDEFLMRKINKVLSKYQDEINSLLVNNAEHCVNQEWGLAHPNGKQITFRSMSKKPDNLAVAKFTTRKEKNLFDIGNLSIYSEEVKEAVTKILEGEVNEHL